MSTTETPINKANDAVVAVKRRAPFDIYGLNIDVEWDDQFYQGVKHGERYEPKDPTEKEEFKKRRTRVMSVLRRAYWDTGLTPQEKQNLSFDLDGFYWQFSLDAVWIDPIKKIISISFSCHCADDGKKDDE